MGSTAIACSPYLLRSPRTRNEPNAGQHGPSANFSDPDSPAEARRCLLASAGKCLDLEPASKLLFKRVADFFRASCKSAYFEIACRAIVPTKTQNIELDIVFPVRPACSRIVVSFAFVRSGVFLTRGVYHATPYLPNIGLAFKRIDEGRALCYRRRELPQGRRVT